MGGLRIERIELRRVSLPLAAPWVTSLHRLDERDVILLRIITADGDGWGECSALPTPTYTAEYTAGAHRVLARYLLPLLRSLRDPTAARFRREAGRIAGHPMAKSAVETALLDLEAQAAGESLSRHLGGTAETVPAGVVLGEQPDLVALLAAVSDMVERGYRTVKLKVRPGHDVEILGPLREVFADLPIGVDANGAYAGDPGAVRRLDAFGLEFIEHPLAPHDLLGHAVLAHELSTPIGLDEPLASLEQTATALALGACTLVNLKASRVGGLLEAVEIHDLARRRGVGLRVGGMLETGVGRAATVALASLPGFTCPGDLSENRRFYPEDVVATPFLLDGDSLRVPTAPGLGVEIDSGALARFTSSTEWY